MNPIKENEFISDSLESNHSTETENDVSMDLNVLGFFTKITQELQSHLRQNNGNEDYCEEIYENVYTNPQSGSYSYYRDLLTMAKDTGNELDTSTNLETSQSGTTEYKSRESTCSWSCSGFYNPLSGLGPFQELFEVLKHSPSEYYFQPQSYTSSYLNMDSCIPPIGLGMSTIGEKANQCEGAYPDIIDIMQWNDDIFPSGFLPQY
ncbi:hypothetical protein JTE90_019749 [Oedothorax gibbosus]|uniref:Uncharacterized protein n=1 Tax=Oedothorax gibbosus TaxID=931172 RepID=A0AAV6UQE4_9ARAC|nr:hypothetical protein JTE90_019749 [Oedothorax gibbosus]